MDPEIVTDIIAALGSLGSLGSAVATGALVIVGVRQIRGLSDQIELARKQMVEAQNASKLERTLAACSRYESDVTIERCVGTLRRGWDDESYAKDPKQFKHEVVIVLNYLDTIAIGIEQQLYIEDLAADHMKSIFKLYRDKYLNDREFEKMGLDIKDYYSLIKISDRWTESEPKFKV